VKTALLDTNVLIRHLTADHPEQSPRASAFLRRVEAGQVRVWTTWAVVFEAVFTLERVYRRSKAEVRDALVPLLELPGLRLPGKRRLRRVLDLYVDLNLPFADAYHAVWMEERGISEIISFDRDFDRIPGIVRREP